MNGPHDLGGFQGFGPVYPERNEPSFHADWEKRALGLTLCAGAMGHWTIDESRHARESIPPAIYLGASYYEIWIRALEALLERHGFVTREEMDTGLDLREGVRPKRVLTAESVAGVLARGGPCDRLVDGMPRFEPGDRVRTRNINPSTHNRLPRYAKGKIGRIEAVQGGFVFPDDNAHGKGENPQWVYTVVFDAPELWGEGADPNYEVSIDAWESYLEPV